VNSFRCSGPSPSLSLEADKQVLIENIHGSAAWIFGLPPSACFVCAHHFGDSTFYIVAALSSFSALALMEQ
jgi:hypothetical protein